MNSLILMSETFVELHAAFFSFIVIKVKKSETFLNL